jgi:hypothetical protein
MRFSSRVKPAASPYNDPGSGATAAPDEMSERLLGNDAQRAHALGAMG